MKKLLTVFMALIALTTISVNAESLFTLGATQHYQGVPRSLFGGVQAHQIGDLISIIMQENISLNDNLSYSSAKESNTVDNFTSYIKSWFGIAKKLKPSDGYGGSNEVTSSANGSARISRNSEETPPTADRFRKAAIMWILMLTGIFTKQASSRA